LVGFLTTRRRRFWRLLALVLDSPASALAIAGIFAAAAFYAQHHTGAEPDPGPWPLLLAGFLITTWAVAWLAVLSAAIRGRQLKPVGQAG
jgi:hypothetical protein